MITLVSAKANETVHGLLYRFLNDDSDKLVDAFFQLNPKQTTLFLEPMQEVFLPRQALPSEEEPRPHSEPFQVLDVWE